MTYFWDWVSGFVLGFNLLWELKSVYIALGIVEVFIVLDEDE